jgi:ribonuclease VapC
MSEPAVLDASAILCVMLQEKGSDKVEPLLDTAVISAVNFAEVFSKLRDRGVDETMISAIIAEFEPVVVDFDKRLALHAAELRNKTRHRGLSLGDRACLALAASRGAVAVTTDKAWQDLSGISPILLVR